VSRACTEPTQRYCDFLDSLPRTHAYVTYQDIRELGNLRDQTVIVVKAPSDTKLEVPDPEEVCKDGVLGEDGDGLVLSCAVINSMHAACLRDMAVVLLRCSIVLNGFGNCGRVLITSR